MTGRKLLADYSRLLLAITRNAVREKFARELIIREEVSDKLSDIVNKIFQHRCLSASSVVFKIEKAL